MPMTAETLADFRDARPATDVLLIEQKHEGDEPASEVLSSTSAPAPRAACAPGSPRRRGGPLSCRGEHHPASGGIEAAAHDGRIVEARAVAEDSARGALRLADAGAPPSTWQTATSRSRSGTTRLAAYGAQADHGHD